MALSEFLSVVVLLLVSSAVGHSRTLPSTRPLVIAHRGASGVLPEHSVESFKRALSDGADILHCDATLSRDLVPLCLHEYELSVTTDVADRPEFRDRLRNITVNHNGELVRYVFAFTTRLIMQHVWTARCMLWPSVHLSVIRRHYVQKAQRIQAPAGFLVHGYPQLS